MLIKLKNKIESEVSKIGNIKLGEFGIQMCIRDSWEISSRSYYIRRRGKVMYGTIQLSEVLFNAHISSLTKAQASLAGVSKPNFNTTSESKVLDLYQEQFNELYQLMTSYTSLLGTDIALMSATGKELARTDTVLGQTMFSGLQ